MARTQLPVLLWLLLEACLCAYQIFTEPTYAFDLDAYFEQASIWMGTPRLLAPSKVWQLDYAELKGDTGALVYPAGHLYIHAALLRLTRWDVNRWTTELTPKAAARLREQDAATRRRRSEDHWRLILFVWPP
jgi:hypothetical protein